MLYAMMYGAMVDFALDSDYIDSAMQNLKRPFRFNYSPNCSVGLLDLQLKEALAGLLRKQVEICLSRLHTLMMKQTEDSWGPAVAYIIILCLCGEMVPVSVDYRLVREALEKGVEVVREDTVEIMRNIYDQPIRIMVELFHASFATHRAKKGEKGKEPVKLFVEMNARTNCAPALKKFVLELKEVQWKHGQCNCIQAHDYKFIMLTTYRPSFTRVRSQADCVIEERRSTARPFQISK